MAADVCVAGEGPGCAAAAAESPLVRDLLEKSRVNKTKNETAARERYWKEGYGSYFSFGSNKVLEKDSATGAWSLQEPDDFVTRTIRGWIGKSNTK